MERPTKRHKQESPYSVAESEDLTDDSPGLPTGVHKKCRVGPRTLQRLHSCERVFCSQTLSEPMSEPLPGSPIPTGEDSMPSNREFCISYSQNYVYKKSSASLERQSQADSPDGAGPSSWESEQSNFHHPALGGVQEPQGGAQQQQQDHSTTPELCGEPHQGSPQPEKFFPLFRPVAQWKTLYMVRHGESEYNAASMTKEGFSDPQVYNPKLTAKGRKQAQKLQESLGKLKLGKDALWVTSPMTRAIETMMLGCPHAARIGAAPQAKPLKVAVCRELAERMMTTGDIGLPASHLRNAFPQLSGAMEELPERWWFRHDENDALLKRFKKHENKAQMQARVGEFRRWVQNRPEKVIVAFGHSVLFKELSGGHKSLKNCEIHTINI